MYRDYYKNMKIAFSLVAKPKKNVSFVFFLFDNEDIAKQPLFSFLNKEEQAYIRGAKKSFQLKEKETRTFFMSGSNRKVIAIGLGKASDFSAKKIGLAHRMAVQAAKKEKVDRFAFWAAAQKTAKETCDAYEVAVSNTLMANFEFVRYKTPPPEGHGFIKEIQLVVAKSSASRDIAEGVRRGTIIGEETNTCRALSNTPGGDMTPQMLAQHAIKEARTTGGVKATILDEKKMKALGMGGVLGVGQGSDAPPRFIVLEYMKGAKNEKPVVLVGKGVTFDTGGLNLKPGNHIYEMHMDMSGGAAVIHTIIAAARLKLRKNIVALIPAVENMPSGSSYRPGDVLRTMNGKTIEVLNTDAEGRVILADALEYAKRYNPALVVDVATLTGAAVVALGLRYSAIFTTDKKLEERFRALGEAVNDPVWPLPLGEEYEEDIKGTFGDWANAGKPGEAGATSGAVFLWQFIKGYPWVHLDIAPRMTAMENEYLAKGAAGTPVRLLARLLEE
jgi:leucyl aminopeptidase